MQDIAYALDNTLYLNITNRCTNECTFCIRNKARKFHGKYQLWLDHEPTVEETIAAIGDPNKYKQIVFCGYGEPLIRLDAVKEIASWIKSQARNSKSETISNIEYQISKIETQISRPLVRIDTNGQANLFHGRNILPELKDLIDVMSISLNAEKSEVYDALCNSFFGNKAYAAVTEFIKEAKKYIPTLEISVVGIPTVDIEKCKKIAEELGVKLRIRTYYEEKYTP